MREVTIATHVGPEQHSKIGSMGASPGSGIVVITREQTSDQDLSVAAACLYRSWKSTAALSTLRPRARQSCRAYRHLELLCDIQLATVLLIVPRSPGLPQSLRYKYMSPSSPLRPHTSKASATSGADIFTASYAIRRWKDKRLTGVKQQIK
nr:hypothetical protein CFP56_01419 [Quercus suber]